MKKRFAENSTIGMKTDFVKSNDFKKFSKLFLIFLSICSVCIRDSIAMLYLKSQGKMMLLTSEIDPKSGRYSTRRFFLNDCFPQAYFLTRVDQK
jgi:hypothetical protein